MSIDLSTIPPAKARPRNAARDLDILQRFANGERQEAIGREYGISVARVRQVVSKSLRKHPLLREAPGLDLTVGLAFSRAWRSRYGAWPVWSAVRQLSHDEVAAFATPDGLRGFGPRSAAELWRWIVAERDAAAERQNVKLRQRQRQRHALAVAVTNALLQEGDIVLLPSQALALADALLAQGVRLVDADTLAQAITEAHPAGPGIRAEADAILAALVAMDRAEQDERDADAERRFLQPIGIDRDGMASIMRELKR